MKALARFLGWILKAALFFTLFAFALNNQQDATVHFFFGTQWRAPLVLVVLGAFTLGVVVGVLGMVPRWWRHNRPVHRPRSTVNGDAAASSPAPESAVPTAQPGHGS